MSATVVQHRLVGEIEDLVALNRPQGAVECDPGIVVDDETVVADGIETSGWELLAAPREHRTDDVVTSRRYITERGLDHGRVVLTVHDD